MFRPLAFSMMPLSIMVMMGATSVPAAPAASASLPRRRPSLFVFHRVVASVVVSLAVVIAEDGVDSVSFSTTGSSPMASDRFTGFCSSPIAASSCGWQTCPFGAACNVALLVTGGWTAAHLFHKNRQGTPTGSWRQHLSTRWKNWQISTMQLHAKRRVTQSRGNRTISLSSF